MWVLTLNSGSSSIKYSLFKSTLELCLEERGLIEKIGEEVSYFLKENQKKRLRVKNHREAVEIILEEIKNKIQKPSELIGIGHRVVHGGEKFKSSVILDNKVLGDIKKYTSLAPLHNPPAVLVIEACIKLLKEVKQIAVFDTSFHQTLPEYAYIYALPYEFYKKYRIRKYGFHGTSHKYVAIEASKILGKPLNRVKLIICHLGNGCSITAIKNGKSIDTSMGFTPLEGLVMGTRCGDIDPAIIFFLINKGYRPGEIETMLNKKSGLLGLSGISNDMRLIVKEYWQGSKRAKLAYEVFIYRLAKYISSYLGILAGCDAIVFTGGIGENQLIVREDIKKLLKTVLKKFKVKVLVIPTNEELMIAKEVLRLVNYED